ncbi:MAG: C13 family peptidase [Burkholderiales bacterium]
MSHRIRTFSVISLFTLLTGLFTYAAPSEPTAVTPDGGRSFGALVNGKFDGTGRIEWDNGSSYEGSFSQGYFSGRGLMRWPSGQRYEGEFLRGEMSVQGRLERADGEVYEGEFRKDDFTGQGVRTSKDGSRHEGRFEKWRPNGAGRYTDSSGNAYEGKFKDGELIGIARLRGKSGGTYEGEVKDWRPHGKGVLRLSTGDIYQGAFEEGVYHGQGTLKYAKARPDGRTEESGVWSYGYLPDQKGDAQAKENVETALYNQRALLDKSLAALASNDRSRINLYFVGVAGDGSQEVFRREIEYVQNQFNRAFGTTGRSVTLVNSRTTVSSVPMATVTSIRETFKAIAARMDPDRDILFLYLTSHGSKQHELTLSQPNMLLRGLSASELGKLLKESGIRHKVVVISACYSGGFIDAVKSDHTLVITAARHDRTSFGCADENEFTYFGRAFFKEALPSSSSFQDAFRKAQALVNEWEDKELKPEERARGHSLPQMAEAPAIAQHLERWWSQQRSTAATATASKH